MKRLLGLLIALILVLSYFTSIVYAVPSEQSTADYLMEYVSRFMERRTQPLVESTQSSTQEVVPLVIRTENGTSRLGNEAVVRESQAIFFYEVEVAEELSNWRDLFVIQWGGYSHFDMELTLLSYNICTDNAVLLVREFTRLYFAEQRPNLDYTSWQLNRTFVFERDAPDWVLISQDAIVDSPILPLNEPIGITRAEIMDALNLHINMER